MSWTLEEAVSICKKVEEIAPKYGCHVALTGGTLYKEGARKDLDLLFYRIRQADRIEYLDLLEALDEIGFTTKARYGWVCKATYDGRDVDLFFPEVNELPAPVVNESTPSVIWHNPVTTVAY